ncbi:MAG: hypothetical protein M5R40_23810 [Anaerolineae bacterium]|nr:hypothetical protein [Anaerolineae bacterium]
MSEMPKTSAATTGGVVAARADQGSQLVSEVIGTSFLGLLVVFGFFALLRAQRRNRNLMRELMECRVALARAEEAHAAE